MSVAASPPLAQATPVPSVRRRLACMVYEAMLLFGVVMVAGLLYSGLTEQRHALQGSTGLQVVLFIVLGIYFIGFWSSSGQTLAMKTWHIQLQAGSGRPPGRARAALRYLASWLWFLPALASAHAADVRSVVAYAVIVVAGMATYVLLAKLRPDRQWLHDVFCGTRLVDVRPATTAPAQSGP